MNAWLPTPATGTWKSPVWQSAFSFVQLEGLDHAHHSVTGRCIKTRWGSCGYIPPPLGEPDGVLEGYRQRVRRDRLERWLAAS